MKIENEFIQGTASEFIEEGWHYNGQKLDAVAFSILSKYDIISVIGKTQKVEGKRGKPGNIFSIHRSQLSKAE